MHLEESEYHSILSLDEYGDESNFGKLHNRKMKHKVKYKLHLY